MTFLAQPISLVLACLCKVLRRKGAILGWMPLRSQLRIHRRKIIDTWLKLLPHCPRLTPASDI